MARELLIRFLEQQMTERCTQDIDEMDCASAADEYGLLFDTEESCLNAKDWVGEDNV